MASSIGSIRQKLQRRLRDDAAHLTNPTDLDLAIAAAGERYSKDRPREVVAQVDGTGAFSYTLSSILSAVPWVDGFSAIQGIVYPYDATDQDPVTLDQDRYAVRRLASGLVLHFFEHTPATTEDFLVEYTVPHTIDEVECTVLAGDVEAVADLAAAEAFGMLASRSIQELQSNIDADTVDRQSKAREYREQASFYRKRYESKIQSSDDKPRAAAAYAEADAMMAHNQIGTDRFFHGRDRF